MSIVPPLHGLDLSYPLKWTTHNSPSRDLPFYCDRNEETPEQYVVRTYLQFLWLPESIMPLQLLVPSLLRVSCQVTPETDGPHPLHSHIEPLLLTSRSCTNKYHTEVPQILADEGGVGDIEEGTMWFALGYEREDEDMDAAASNSKDSSGGDEEPWKKKWLERMERREVQIQILLHLLLLSLPGPFPVPTGSPRKRKRSSVVGDSPVKPDAERGRSALETRLESFMDKLSTWQLLSSLDEDVKGKGKEKDREPLDWMQVFCQNIVEPQFTVSLPELTDLLRSKIFPYSPFSSSSRSTSPVSRSPSPFSSSANPAKRSKQDHRSESKGPQPQRGDSRARSLSLSLLKDRTDVVPGRKKLSREVSMNRVFKPKPKAIPKPADAKAKTKSKQESEGRVKTTKESALGVTLVAATPVKNRTRLVYAERRSPVPLYGVGSSQNLKGEEEDDELLLGGVLDDDGADWEIGENVLIPDTPTKRVR